MSFNLTRAAKITRVKNAEAAAQTAIECTAVDMKRFRSAAFLVAFGAITSGAVTSVKVQQSADAAGSPDTWADLEGTGVTVADDDDNQIVVVEVDQPQERYLRCVVDRGTQDAVVDGVIAVQFNADEEPVTQSDTVADAEYSHAPAEGTA